MYRVRNAITTILAAGLLLVVAASAGAQSTPRQADPILGAYRSTVVAVGDIACNARVTVTPTECQHAATARLAESLNPDKVLVLGDTQYFDGTAAEFAGGYEPTWGRLKDRTLAAVGNHEYHVPGAADYYAYFGAAAGRPDRGFYGTTVGGWRMIALNSMCSQVGGCEDGSVQQRWLAYDLKRYPTRCTIAFWHHPRYSSTRTRSGRMSALWRTLQKGGAEMVLSGHDHDYERFAPMNAGTQLNYVSGLRSFVVGTGGQNLFDLSTATWTPGSERLLAQFGVLGLTLYSRGYRWAFHTIDGEVADSGFDLCHGRPAPVLPTY